MRFLVLERTSRRILRVLRYKVSSVDERPGITGMALANTYVQGNQTFRTTDYEANYLSKKYRFFGRIIVYRTGRKEIIL
jgi:hypothetical protein